jgi:beta-galactosidase
MESLIPSGFIWGVATSAYQIEGAPRADGRGPSIWDRFCEQPGKTRNVSGNFPRGQYERLEEDIAALRDLGVDAYRFSIAWPRLFPDGATFNAPGARFYDRLIDGLLEAGITPWVTLYHWDLPLALHEKFGGWTDRRCVEAFVHYADACFDRYADRVKHWITLNEPWCSSVLGYATGTHAPGLRDPSLAWRAGHHLLLAHGEAVRCFRTRHQPGHGGCIGLVNNCDFRRPLRDCADDRGAAGEALELMFGWFGDPVWNGDYPESVKRAAGPALPAFTGEEKDLLHGSSDFLGLNHYATYYASRVDRAGLQEAGNAGIFGSDTIRLTPPADAEVTAMNWPVVPDGLREMLHWLDRRYNHPPIYVTENGIATREADAADAADDAQRGRYLIDYARAALQARREGVDVRGYFAWCLLDTFEWAWGYDVQFGLIRHDMLTGERVRKGSFLTYRDWIQTALP